MFCPRCGVESPDGVRYCSACGAELPRPDAADPGATRRTRLVQRLRRLIGRDRRERIVSGVTVAVLVVAVVAFIRLRPGEDEATSAARGKLDTACVTAKGEVVQAANALSGPDGAEQYSVLVVIAMLDLREATVTSAIHGAEALGDAAFDAAVAAGRFGRLTREGASQTQVRAALQQSTKALEGLGTPTKDLQLTNCAGTTIKGGG